VRAVLVTVEVAMSMIRLITSGLLIRAVWRVQAIDPGFAPQNVLTLRTALPRPKYDSPVRRGEFYERVFALGAEPSRVGRMIFADGMPLALFGIVPGVLGAYAAARGMSALPFGVAPGDPATFAAGIGAALLMTFAGSLVPTVRAVRVTPMSVLRAE